MTEELHKKIINKSFNFEDESGIIMDKTITIKDLYEILNEYEILDKFLKNDSPTINCSTCSHNDKVVDGQPLPSVCNHCNYYSNFITK